MTNLRALIDSGLPLTLGDVIEALEKRAHQPLVTMSDAERAFVEVLAEDCRRRRDRAKKAA